MRVTSYSLVIYKYVTKLMQAYKCLQNWRTQALTENMGEKMWIFFSRLYLIYRKHIMSFYDGWYTNVTTSKLILLILIIPLSLLNHRHTFVCIFYFTHCLTGMFTSAGLAKSTVRVIRVVQLAIRTTAFFIFTCPWTTKIPVVEHCLPFKMLFRHVLSTYQTANAFH